LSQSGTYKEANSELVERCKKGDRASYKELYNLYAKAMFSICMRLLNNKEEAEDCLQESFISAFNSISQYNGKASFGSWLKRIVINRCLDAIQKRKLDFVPIEFVDVLDEEKEEIDETVYTVEGIKEAMKGLPDGYRIILTLFLFEEYSHKMIAEKLNISESTSKSQYHRARKKLQELITSKALSHER
jgi:RNA polymerase sigma factor (sigma-70 family)